MQLLDVIYERQIKMTDGMEKFFKLDQAILNIAGIVKIMNRLMIYVSGLAGILLLSLYILGLFADKSYDHLILISGILLIVLICVPMILLERRRRNRKIEEIIHQHKKTSKEKIGHSSDAGKKVRGWSMNQSPFRERKSGTTWSGGNIHGALPKRQSRKGLFRN